jgi:hypothetical protein
MTYQCPYLLPTPLPFFFTQVVWHLLIPSPVDLHHYADNASHGCWGRHVARAQRPARSHGCRLRLFLPAETAAGALQAKIWRIIRRQLQRRGTTCWWNRGKRLGLSGTRLLICPSDDLLVISGKSGARLTAQASVHLVWIRVFSMTRMAWRYCPLAFVLCFISFLSVLAVEYLLFCILFFILLVKREKVA